MESGELRPDHGPAEPHPSAGATLVTARPPLAAFNVELDSGDVEVARAVAAGLRESGGGLPGVRAIGLALGSGRAQVSTNVHDPLGDAARRSSSSGCGSWRRRSAPARSRPSWSAWSRRRRWPAIPEDVPIRGFDPARHTIERRAGARPADRLDLARGPDQEEAPPQAPGHPGRPHRHQTPRPSRAAARRRKRRPARAAPAAARAATARRPGAARSTAASSPR